MLVKPKRPFSREFNFVLNGKVIGDFRTPLILSWSKTCQYTLFIEGTTYAVNSPYIFQSTLSRVESRLELLEGSKSLAVINRQQEDRTSLFTVDYGNKKLRVELNGFGKHTVYNGNQTIGEIRYRNIFLRSKMITLPASVPLAIQAFAFLGTILSPIVNTDI